MDNGMRKCMNCGAMFDVEREGVETNEGEVYCKNCAEGRVFPCSDCDVLHSIYYYKGNPKAIYGVNRKGQKVYYCEHCGEFYCKFGIGRRVVNVNELKKAKSDAFAREFVND